MKVTLPSRMRIREARALRSFLDDRLGLLSAHADPGAGRSGERPPCLVDGAGVEAVDSAGLQLLLAFLRSVEEGGHDIAWQDASGALVGAARTLGMVNMLRLGELAGGVEGLSSPPGRAPLPDEAGEVGGRASGPGGT